ncbi:iron-sulfur cluster assembly protein [Cryptococcus wingfieldii CBS 7118]|uniref:Iron-sulfur assembly protein 1 n=1 Tax=Cryptococcus wingfieldii CBS 7118 TaxID=1295528 RepID=A0A1E3IVS1_9TREE|nr:iron-sulfur cluster assembly protein [Cryptococcus wingfieldii CBS 7118]ODN92713.1 iron-sulfur cluster assembly protein [Cryptococcus wingfieldii CBS 7118]
MAFPAFRTTFASTSRVTLHHLPPLTHFARSGSSLAHHVTSPSPQSYSPTSSPAYHGSVGQQGQLQHSGMMSGGNGKGGVKEMHVAPTPTPPAAPAPKVQPKASERPPRRTGNLRGKKAPITMTPAAIEHLRALVSSPTEPRLLRIGVKTRGCAGMAYHLDYVPPPGGKFDEVVEQDGVRVLIDSKALFSIIGSRMDWRDTRLSAGFVFDNPNVVDTCGCGESFNIRF